MTEEEFLEIDSDTRFWFLLGCRLAADELLDQIGGVDPEYRRHVISAVESFEALIERFHARCGDGDCAICGESDDGDE